MEKVFVTWEKVFATWKKCSQHNVWMLVATCSQQARNMYTMSGEEGAGRNIEKVFAT
jgi:hypothetical protein